MQSLGLLHSLNCPAFSSAHSSHERQPTCYSNFKKPAKLTKRGLSRGIQPAQRSVTRMVANSEDYELKQMKDMAAARKRWEALLREGKVKVVTPKEAGYAIQLSDKTLLDVRPSTERKKAWVKGSIWIPIFDVDNRFDAGTLSKKITNFTMGGWWSGVPPLSYDNEFLAKVGDKFSKEDDLIVACQKGLRSNVCLESLHGSKFFCFNTH